MRSLRGGGVGVVVVAIFLRVLGLLVVLMRVLARLGRMAVVRYRIQWVVFWFLVFFSLQMQRKMLNFPILQRQRSINNKMC